LRENDRNAFSRRGLAALVMQVSRHILQNRTLSSMRACMRREAAAAKPSDARRFGEHWPLSAFLAARRLPHPGFPPLAVTRNNALR
jgi:hypothetical protein